MNTMSAKKNALEKTREKQGRERHWKISVLSISRFYDSNQENH